MPWSDSIAPMAAIVVQSMPHAGSSSAIDTCASAYAARARAGMPVAFAICDVHEGSTRGIGETIESEISAESGAVVGIVGLLRRFGRARPDRPGRAARPRAEAPLSVHLRPATRTRRGSSPDRRSSRRRPHRRSTRSRRPRGPCTRPRDVRAATARRDRSFGLDDARRTRRRRNHHPRTSVNRSVRAIVRRSPGPGGRAVSFEIRAADPPLQDYPPRREPPTRSGRTSSRTLTDRGAPRTARS